MRDEEEEKELQETFLRTQRQLTQGWERKSKIILCCAKTAGKLPLRLHLMCFLHSSHGETMISVLE